MVVIGNEILSGKITDSNSAFLARELRNLGVSLERITVVPDEIDVVADAVSYCSEQFDFVFTSGGIGPTHDDVTIDGVARAFGVAVIEHPSLRRTIEEHAGADPPGAYLKMAQVPEGSELVEGDKVPFATVKFRNVYVLPGIPEIFEAKVRALCERFRTRPYHIREVLVREAEADIAPYLNATLAAFPDLLLGSYPKLSHPDYRVRLTLESKDEGYVERALEDLIGRMPAKYVVRTTG